MAKNKANDKKLNQPKGESKRKFAANQSKNIEARGSDDETQKRPPKTPSKTTNAPTVLRHSLRMMHYQNMWLKRNVS